MSDVARTVGQPPGPITVLVAHRRAADRESLVRWLSADERFEVVADVSDTVAALDAVMGRSPQVALIDVDLSAPGAGIGLIATISDVRPATSVIAISDEDDDRAYSAVPAGARGCYLWSAPASPLTSVVAGAVRGEGALTAGWAGRLIDEIGWLSREPNGLRAPVLTATELEVVRRIGSGATPSAIATLHGVTEHVVNVHAGIVVTKVFRHHDDTRRLGVGG